MMPRSSLRDLRVRRLSWLALVSVACAGAEPPAPNADSLHAKLAGAVQQGPGTRVSLDSLAPGPWRAIYVFAPYTPDEWLRRCVGAKVYSNGIEAREDINLIVFVDTANHARSVAVKRLGVDFAPEGTSHAYAPDSAIFVVRNPASGAWGQFVPAARSMKRCTA